MQDCGPQALGIVTLINFLVGVIVAFVGAIELRRFGAGVYVADPTVTASLPGADHGSGVRVPAPVATCVEFGPRDLKGDPHSSIFSAMDTLVIGGDLAKVVAWYDNEWGYSLRVADLITYVAEKERRG